MGWLSLHLEQEGDFWLTIAVLESVLEDPSEPKISCMTWENPSA